MAANRKTLLSQYGMVVHRAAVNAASGLRGPSANVEAAIAQIEDRRSRPAPVRHIAHSRQFLHSVH